jgi:SAM-dependent methyltransferase
LAADSSRPEFWDTRYRDGATPWDAGRVPPKLAQWLPREPAARRVLVPGCGSGYEVRAFAEHGDDVLGIDFSDAAIEAARRTLGELAGRVRKADFFALDDAQPFDLVYERTFLCALPPRERLRWARRIAELVRAGGLLAGFFYYGDGERGPPFGITARELHALLDPAFALLEDEAVPAAQSVPVLAGNERWQLWKRRL